LILSPEISLGLGNQGFLSPDGLSYSFDHRANGFARGEGFVSLVIKPVHLAVRDGDMIRAVIRSSGSNSDGRTPGLTQPSAEAQETLIRQVYARAALDFKSTHYFEAHGGL
jgi:acyl transferase domain-containing protein